MLTNRVEPNHHTASGCWDTNIEHVLETEGMVVSTTAGVSMKPLLRDRRDTIVIRPVRSVRENGILRRYDVPLYRRASDGAYVLHRVIRLQHTPSGLVYVIRGDNTYTLEYVRPEQVIGILSECYRGNRRIDLNGCPYRTYVHIWTMLYPLRYSWHVLHGLLARTPLRTLYRFIRGRSQ